MIRIIQASPCATNQVKPAVSLRVTVALDCALLYLALCRVILIRVTESMPLLRTLFP